MPFAVSRAIIRFLAKNSNMPLSRSSAFTGLSIP